MENLLQTVDEIRRMSESELAQVAEDGLTTRLREQGEAAHLLYGGLQASNLGSFLEDRNHVRRPTRLVMEFGEMGMHQFAQPDSDIRNPDGRVLYLRPVLGKRPDYLVRAVAYMIPLINYGEIIGDEHCITYGAALYAETEDQFYHSICELADWVGATESFPAASTSGSPCSCH